MRNQLARPFGLLAFVGLGALLAVGAASARADATLRVAPNPCVAGEPATVCAVVSDGATEITSAKVNGTDANMTVLDSANVMITIPSGVIQAGSNTLILTKPGDTLTGIIDGIPPIGTPVGLVDFFASAADQIKATTIARMAGHREEALSSLIGIQTHAEGSAVAREGKRAISSSARDGLRLLREIEHSVIRSLQGIIQHDPSPETARAVRAARRSVQTTSSQVRKEIRDQEHFDRDVVSDTRDQMFDVLKIDNAEDADKVIDKAEEDNTARNPAAATAIAACAAAAKALIASRAWHPRQLALIASHAACVLANLAAPCACLTTTPPGKFDISIFGQPEPDAWGFREISLRQVPGGFRITVDILVNPPLTQGEPVKLQPDANGQVPSLFEAVDLAGNNCDATIGNPVSDGARVKDAFTGSSTLDPVHCPPCTLILAKYEFKHGNTFGWQTILIHLTD